MEKINFPKMPGKHRFKPLFGAENLLKDLKGAFTYKKAVLIYSKELLKKFNEANALRHSDIERRINPNGIYEFDGNRLLVYLAMGAPLTAVVAEELIAIGVKEFLIMGTAGSLRNDLKIGSIVVCTKALRDEGVSHHYLPNGKYVEPSKDLTKRIEKILKKKKVNFAKGATWTIDAPYAETVQEVERYSREGISTVEMEAATLFAVAKRRKVKAAALFTISDILDKDNWSGIIEEEYRHEKIYPIFAKLAAMW
ncbi:MAG: nucleoside phosphorylase [Candidatus Micrarchaeia archaeon]